MIYYSLKSSNVTTLVERKSRFVRLVHNKAKYTDEVIGGITNVMKGIPKKYRKTITFDIEKTICTKKDRFSFCENNKKIT